MISYNKEIDKENIKIFEIWGINNPKEKRYKCVICEEATNVYNCRSNKGHKLVCNKCFVEKFNHSLISFKKWLKDD